MKNSLHGHLGKLISLVFLIHFSCQKVKTSDLLPHSSSILIKINLPELISVKENQKLLNELIHNKSGINISESGLDFFQPVYFFKTTFAEKEGYFLLAGLEEQESFINALQKLNPSKKAVQKESFNCMDVQNARVVWKDNFCLFEFFDPILGSKFLPEDLAAFLKPDQIKRGIDSFPAKEMISFQANIEEEQTLPFLPTFDAKIRGQLGLQEKKWSLQASMIEAQYSLFFKPFPEPAVTCNEKCFGYVAIKPDLNSLATLLNSYLETMDFYPNSIAGLAKLNQAKGPIFGISTECNSEHWLNNLVLASFWGTSTEATTLKNMIASFLPQTGISKEYQAETRKNWVIFPKTKNANLVLPKEKEQGKNIVFWMNLKQNDSDCKLRIYKEGGANEFKIEANFSNLENVIWPDTKQILSKIPL